MNRLPRLNERGRNVAVRHPGVEGPTATFAAVVARQPHRLPARGDHGVQRRDDGVQRRDHGHARQAVVDGDLQGCPRAPIDRRAAADATPRCELITHEVDAPGVVGHCGLGARHPRYGEPLAFAPWHRQSLEAVQAFDAFAVHALPLALQLPVQSWHPPAHVRRRERAELVAHRRAAVVTVRFPGRPSGSGG